MGQFYKVTVLRLAGTCVLLLIVCLNFVCTLAIHSDIFTEIWLSVHLLIIVEYSSTFECPFGDTNTDQFRLY